MGEVIPGKKISNSKQIALIVTEDGLDDKEFDSNVKGSGFMSQSILFCQLRQIIIVLTTNTYC